MTGPEIIAERASLTPFRLSWGAVFAGLLVALMVQLVLTVAGTAIGLGAWDPNSGEALGVGAAIWTIVSVLIALYVGGRVAGWVADAVTRPVGVLHGALVWALTTLVTLWLVASGISTVTGAALGLAGKAVGATASVAAQGAAATIGSAAGNANVSASGLRAQVESVLRETGDPALNPDSLATAAHRLGNATTQSSASNGTLVDDLVKLIQAKAGSVGREDIVNVIVARTGKSRPEAERLADRFVALEQTTANQIDTLRHDVAQKAQGAATATAAGLWFALLGLVLSFGAAVLGAVGAARRDLNPSREIGPRGERSAPRAH